MYKAGYDPTAMVQFFERLKAMQKKNKNAIAKAFSSHPLTKSRIKEVQKTIDQLLPEQPEYAVSSSEFDDIKERLAKLNARRKPVERDPNRPTLRRSASDEPILPSDIEDDPASDQDDRPKLKRRPVS